MYNGKKLKKFLLILRKKSEGLTGCATLKDDYFKDVSFPVQLLKIFHLPLNFEIPMVFSFYKYLSLEQQRSFFE